VLRPGGKLWLVEPNNLAGVAAMFADPSIHPDALSAAVKLEALTQRGKHALGLGYNSLGERLLGLLDHAQWTNVEIRLCDRVQPVAPPYRAAVLSGAREPVEIFTWPREETMRYYLAGGGDPAQFDALWNVALELNRQRAAAILAGTYAANEGSLLYSTTAVRS
jgi:hypothetical protein